MSNHPLQLTQHELQGLQNEDKTLTTARKVAAGNQDLGAGTIFYQKDGILYRKWLPPGRNEDMTIDQLVVPQKCRGALLKIAHSIPLAGHLGRDKTTQRLLQRFYWPTLYQDVRNYCKRCGECQKARGHKVLKAPLIPLPVVGEPFERIAMDIVGPLPQSSSGNKYILVICDYATRYPEAISLRSIEAEKIANELIKVLPELDYLRRY